MPPFDLPDLEIYELFNYDNIVYNIHHVMDLYQINDSEMIVSFGAALVFHNVVETCSDIDVFISPECSYRLEDEYDIRRVEAPMKNTSMQTIHNIDMFALDGTAHVYTKYHKYSGYPISVEMLDSLIRTYEDRAKGPNKEKYLEKIKLIQDNIIKFGNR